jgi:hypothetical protein
MPFEVTDKNDRLVDAFVSIEDAKAALPQVTEWRQDESRELGWNGWVDPAPYSPPDYKITHVGASRGGFVRGDSDGGRAVVSEPS